MLRAFRIGLLALVAGLGCSSSAWADSYAVLVGVSAPSDSQIQPRKFAEADVQALYDLVTDKAYLGIPEENVRLFLGKEDEKRHAKPATKENILSAVKEVVDKAGKDDMIIVTFVGRGAVLADRTCFFTADATFKDRAKSALAIADLEQELQGLKSEKLLALIDVNYKGINPGEEKLLEPNPMDMLRAFVGSEDKEEHTLPQGRVIYLANGGVAPAVDMESHGIFVQAVLDGLKGAADKDGYEPDGNVTVEELDVYLESRILELARKYGQTKEEKQQAPVDWGGRINHFVITRNPAIVPKVNERLGALAKLNLGAEQAAEGEKLLSKMPKLLADQDLRKLYQKLADGQTSVDAFQKSRSENFAGRKLTAEDAKTFAKKVMDGMNVIKGGYVKELKTDEMVGWAIKGMYRRLEEKVPTDVKEQLDNLGDAKRGKLEEILADVRTRFGKREDLDGHKDVDLALSTMMLNLDYPYTTYIDEDSLKKAEIDFRGRFIGIGIQIRRDMVRDGLLVVSPIKNSPAYKAGLKAGDLITEIVTDMDSKGQPMTQWETVTTRGMKTEDAIKRILGRPNTKITVKVEREGSDQPVEIEIIRNQVNVETVLGVKRFDDDSWDFMLDPKEKIGYIRLTQFTDRSSGDMEAAVKKLQEQGMKALVLDLRFNPGGLLDSAVEISDLFLDDESIVSIRPRGNREKVIKGTHEGSATNFSMVCLVNGSSASGSEIVAAALQDASRAVIVGERSFGKGSVQTIHQFRQARAEIKMTTATFWRPNGKNLNKPSTSGSENEDWGVIPNDNFVVKLERKEMADLFEKLRDQEIIPRRDLPAKAKTEFVDRQLEKALEHLKSQLTAAASPPKKAG